MSIRNVSVIHGVIIAVYFKVSIALSFKFSKEYRGLYKATAHSSDIDDLSLLRHIITCICNVNVISPQMTKGFWDVSELWDCGVGFVKTSV